MSRAAVLRDFETLLDFVGERAIKVSGIYQILPMNGLEERNLKSRTLLIISRVALWTEACHDRARLN